MLTLCASITLNECILHLQFRKCCTIKETESVKMAIKTRILDKFEKLLGLGVMVRRGSEILKTGNISRRFLVLLN